MSALKGQDLGDGILLPSLMIKLHSTLFLDDMTVQAVADALGTKIWIVDGVDGLVEACSNLDQDMAIVAE